MQKCIEFDEQRFKNGQWLSGIRLLTARSAKTLRSTAGKVIVIDGPFAETKEFLGGVVVLTFKDFEQAIRVLSKHPSIPSGVSIEIRPINVQFDDKWNAQMERSQSS